MKWEYTEGDLLASKERVIAHGCNTQNMMGAGIAAQIAAKYPTVREQYGDACNAGQFYLGVAQAVRVYAQPREGESLDERIRGVNAVRTVYNLGTQLLPGADARLNAIQLASANMAAHMLWTEELRVAIPRIGCGIGGLTWPNVRNAIESGFVLAGHHYATIAVYDFVPHKQRPIRKSTERTLGDLVFDGGVGL